MKDGRTLEAPAPRRFHALISVALAGVGLLAFYVLRRNFVQLDAQGAVVNGVGTRILVATYVVALLGATWVYFRRGVTTPFAFFLGTTVTLLLYGRRVASQYIFQDDFHHLLPVLRLGFAGLWTPFVDHITPIWRLLHLVIVELADGYHHSYIFPVVSAINLGLLGATLFAYLRRREVAYPLLWSLLALAYPGYQSVMYWVSTNAMVLSSCFGLAAVYLFETRDPSSAALKSNVKIALLLVASYFCWTTGLGFALYVGVVSAAQAVARWWRADRRSVVELLRLGVVSSWAPTLALVVFVVTRWLCFRLFTDEYLRDSLWLLSAREHGHIFNVLRPLTWPFASIWEGTLILGVVGDRPLAVMRHTLGALPFFLISIGFGMALFGASWVVARKWRSMRHLPLALLFGLMLYAVISMGRGLTLYGDDFMAYALYNDWYRITVVVGMVYLLAQCTRRRPEGSPRRLALPLALGAVTLVFGALCLRHSFHRHNMEISTHDTIANYDGMRCLRTLPWSQSDFTFASRFLYLPLTGSNPTNYWTGYQPSWFDLFVTQSGAVTADENGRFDRARASRLESELEKACGTRVAHLRERHSLLVDTYPLIPGINVLPVDVHVEGDRRTRIQVPEGHECAFGEFQILDLMLGARGSFRDNLAFRINGKPYFVNSLFDRLREVPMNSGDYLALSFETGALPPEARCEDSLVIEHPADVFVIASARLISGSTRPFRELQPTPRPGTVVMAKGVVSRSVIDFDAKDSVAHYGDGWSKMEDWLGSGFRWSMGPKSNVFLASNPSATTLKLRLRTHPGNAGQELSLEWNAKPVGKVPVGTDEWQTVSVTLPEKLAPEQSYRLTLQPKLTNGSGGDTRPLGVAVDAIWLEGREPVEVAGG